MAQQAFLLSARIAPFCICADIFESVERWKLFKEITVRYTIPSNSQAYAQETCLLKSERRIPTSAGSRNGVAFGAPCLTAEATDMVASIAL
jgi:hypothetical protein